MIRSEKEKGKKKKDKKKIKGKGKEEERTLNNMEIIFHFKITSTSFCKDSCSLLLFDLLKFPRSPFCVKRHMAGGRRALRGSTQIP